MNKFQANLKRLKSIDFKSLFKNLKYKYRLVIINESTFETKYSLMLSMLNLLLLASTIFLFSFLFTILLVSTTSLKYYVPGLMPGGQKSQLRELLIESEKVSKQAEGHERWAENIRKVLKGDVNSSVLEYKEVDSTEKDSTD